MNARFEYAAVPPVEMELRFASGDAQGTFTGYGSVFNVRDSYNDMVMPGAFTQTLKEAKKSGAWPAMLLQHGSMLGGDDDMPVGVWTEMDEDDKGLRVTGKLADTTRGQDTYKLLTMTPRPAISGLSIGFYTKEFIAGTKPTEPRRSLKSVDLVECSIVTMPANAKALIDGVKSIRDLERALREVGLSRNDAKALLSGGYKAMTPRDVGGELQDLLMAIKTANGAV